MTAGGLCLPPGANLLQLQEHIRQFVNIINRGETDTFLKVTSAGLITHSLLGNLLRYSVEDLLFFPLFCGTFNFLGLDKLVRLNFSSHLSSDLAFGSFL